MPCLLQFAEALPDTIESIAAADRHEHPIGNAPLELLEKLKGDRLEALDPERICHSAAWTYDAGREPITPGNQPREQFVLTAPPENGSTVVPHEIQLKVWSFFVTEHH